MKFLAVLILIPVLCSGSEVLRNTEQEINDAIFYALDVVLRNEMRNGNPYTGFPVIAPLLVPLFEDVEWRFGHLVDLEGELRNLRIDGLDGFQIINARLSLLTMRFTFDFLFPNIVATGWYNLNGRFGGLIPIFGQGNFRVDMRNFRANGFTQIRLVGLRGAVNITEMSIRMRLPTLNLDIQGVLGGGDLGSVINRAAEDLVPQLLITFEDHFNAFMNNFILPLINPFLNELTLDDIRDLLP